MEIVTEVTRMEELMETKMSEITTAMGLETPTPEIIMAWPVVMLTTVTSMEMVEAMVRLLLFSISFTASKFSYFRV